MCGIFVIAVEKDAELGRAQYEALFERLYVLSESRGKESAGPALVASGRTTRLENEGGCSCHLTVALE